MSAAAKRSQRSSEPVGEQSYCDWFDADGRLVKEGRMRQSVFEVGVVPSCRLNLWKFLFGIYPLNSTYRDQKTIDIENRAHYQALRQRWEILDKSIYLPDDDLVNSPPYMELSEDEDGDSNFSSPNHEPPRHSKKQGANGSVKTSERTLRSISDPAPVVTELDEEEKVRTKSEVTAAVCTNTHLTRTHTSANKANGSAGGKSGGDNSTSLKCGCDFKKHSYEELLDSEGEAMMQILEFPSKVFAMRQPLDLDKSYPRAKRIILRDVMRTDRNYHYFSHKRNLRKVHRILMVYALFHPELGYAQGMNDILARFLVVTDSEVDSYWMFVKYMEGKRADFIEDTMMAKVALVKNLINEIDEDLYDFFESSECRDYLFCHRWLLLDFKREFSFEESIRVFEVLNSHYLELNSDKALVETDKVIAKEFEIDGGQSRAERAMVNLEFTFDLFVCVAILTMHSAEICKAADAASVYGCLNGLSMNMDLPEVLWEAEQLFYKYCRLRITRGFNEIDL